MSCEMHLESVKNRLELLHMVLVFDSEISKRFKINDRILINQERGSLLDFVNYLFGEKELETVRKLRVPVELELKIQQIAIELKSKYIEVINPTILKEQ